MALSQWRRLYWKMEIVGTPTLADCRATESKIKLPLPKSYCEFITTFDAGILGNEFVIWAPNRGGVLEHCDLAKNNRKHRKAVRAQLREHDTPEASQALRLVFFGRNLGTEYFGWDPQELTNKKHNEYSIFVLNRYMDEVEHCADSFEGFINDFCLGDKYFQYNNVDREAVGDRMTYEQQGGMP